MTGAPRLFLTFGRVAHPLAALAEEGAAIAAAGRPIGVQVALVEEGTPAFRLNTPGALRIAPEIVAGLDTRAGLRRLCEDRLLGALGPFAAAARRFLAAYLEAIAAAAGPPCEAAAALTDPSDRYFAALMPLAGVHCLAVSPQNPPRAAGEPVRADVAFWDGRTLRLLLLGTAGGRLPRQKHALDALAEAQEGRVAVMQLAGLPADEAVRAVRKAVGEEALFGAPPYFGPYRVEALRALPA